MPCNRKKNKPKTMEGGIEIQIAIKPKFFTTLEGEEKLTSSANIMSAGYGTVMLSGEQGEKIIIDINDLKRALAIIESTLSTATYD